MEKLSAIFPYNGKTLAIFSTLWKKVFHSVEKFMSREPPHGGRVQRPLLKKRLISLVAWWTWVL